MDTPNLSENIQQKGKLLYERNKQVLNKLKKLKTDLSDKLMHQAHKRAFEAVNCMECANCCKTTSPAIYERDIDRLAKHLRMKPSKFIESYLNKDNDDCYVLKSSPCVFLDDENYCTVYEHRPMACKTYPHTDRKRVSQINDLTLENTLVCPAVKQMLDMLEANFNKNRK